MDGNATSLFNQCCTDTTFAHSLYSYSSSLSWAKGRQIWKFGGEQRLFFNNFFQPGSPTGVFHFTQGVTEQTIGLGNTDQGNSFASLLLGYGDPDSSLGSFGSVANKSKETAFYFQDDWKATSKLTVNLGLRYEWSTPYTDRRNQLQFSDFGADSGIAVPIAPTDVFGGTLVNSTGNLPGATLFPTSGHRNVPVDRNNWAPRVGFAYSVGSNTVIRGGAGVYYGLNVATNFQSVAPAFGNSNPIRFTKDDFQTQFATLANPFPGGFAAPQGQQYGKLALWGLSDNNSLGTTAARNAEIYQWNLGVQHLFPGGITVGADYSGSQSRHLPFSSSSGTANRNFLPSSIRKQLVAEQAAAYVANNCANLTPPLPSVCDSPTAALAEQTPNPFQSLFNGPNAVFNEPTSIYNDATIPLINLLRPFPQYDGSFSGLTKLTASASYNSLQIRFQKRQSHYVSFEGNYTYSKAIDDSSAGANSFITDSLSNGNPQELDNLRAERSVSANDATHRMVLASIVDLPIGRGLWIGRGMNRALDTIVGGWSVSTILTFQSGTPIHLAMASAQLADGNQRPDVVCPQISTGIGYHRAALNLPSGTDNSVFNAACFADPGDQVAGNAPRYFSNLRSDGIRNTDLSLSKEITVREGMKLQIRGEFFNFTNTPRFGLPGTGFGDSNFGVIQSTLNAPRHMQFGVRFQF
jgi:TonB dependent receptor